MAESGFLSSAVCYCFFWVFEENPTGANSHIVFYFFIKWKKLIRRKQLGEWCVLQYKISAHPIPNQNKESNHQSFLDIINLLTMLLPNLLTFLSIIILKKIFNKSYNGHYFFEKSTSISLSYWHLVNFNASIGLFDSA